MGLGKGSSEYWVIVVKLGRILYEMGGVVENITRKAILITDLIRKKWCDHPLWYPMIKYNKREFHDQTDMNKLCLQVYEIKLFSMKL